MLNQCITTSCMLLLISLLCKMTAESSDVAEVHIAQKLVDKAIHWHKVASNGTEILNMYHHLVSSLTFMLSAREILSDTKLEQMTGIDGSLFIREVEQQISVLRQNIKTTYVNPVGNNTKT